MKQILHIRVSFLVCICLLLLVIACRNTPEQISVSTLEVRNLTQSGAVTGGKVDATKPGIVVSRGICWSTDPTPSPVDNNEKSGGGPGDFFITISGLRPETEYFARAFAITVSDTIYGEIVSFETPGFGTLTDIDGNEYKTVTIGTQTWMAENLSVTTYNDGKVIRLVTDSLIWTSLSSPSFCWYNNDEEVYKKSYGALYNGYTAGTGKLCPAGWHVPSDAEWDILAASLGGADVAGGRMKEAGTSRWVRPNTGASNMSNFNALPGGLRYYDGNFRDLGFGAYWWSSTQLNPERAFFRFIFHEESTIFRFDNLKRIGFSVRCLKDK
ncbi:MAG TPA: FISUMP domain-containing protein [Bacteroidales bacterium]|nr:FISUMP domain-containing protein [Bacteroidales bacterium]HOX75130.1 FISUMP domain-containing protein [Bacteroidales bacterium]HQM68365.1 FISUMP domain-containing protein [Bacteroidales bacterium]